MHATKRVSWALAVLLLAGGVALTGCPRFPLIAAFTATPRSGSAPLEVRFTDMSVNLTGSPITSWSWNFGDGGTSDARNPRHVYQQAGAYTVTLEVRTAETSSTVTREALIAVTSHVGEGEGEGEG
ncbi:MAG TPA: PKD domain-containing protein, partial [Candidatus Hydrogenedentes bacterium]|nr:PKD domain-containing protein [Candidatus Hydrogenedentota bacterium]